MNRDAKTIAVQDISFWNNTLPLLNGLHRIVDDYTQTLTPSINLSIDRASGYQLHKETLEEFVRQFETFDAKTETAARARTGVPIWFSIKFGPNRGHRRLLPPLSDDETPSTLLARSLLDLVFNDRDLVDSGLPPDEVVDIHVEVPGCGSVGRGEVDLSTSSRLVELKLTAGGPGLRDIRQILTYAGLMKIAGWSVPSAGAVANPRIGTVVQFEFDELLLLTGGIDLDAFADTLAQQLAAETTSA